ncbi:MAG: hypothetical protein Kow009_09050 [Spirochaetales bacterium]
MLVSLCKKILRRHSDRPSYAVQVVRELLSVGEVDPSIDEELQAMVSSRLMTNSRELPFSRDI